MGTAIKHPVPDRVKPSFVIFDIRALWRSGLRAPERPDVKNYKWRLNPVWHRMLYSCTHMATVGFKGLIMLSTVNRGHHQSWYRTAWQNSCCRRLANFQFQFSGGFSVPDNWNITATVSCVRRAAFRRRWRSFLSAFHTILRDSSRPSRSFAIH